VLSGEQRRNFLARATAIDADGHARPVILKATRSPTYNPAAENVFQTSGLAKEWVATALLASRVRGRGHGCMFLAGDVANGILIFEDLGADLATIVDPLLKGTLAEAENALKLYATALARLHSDTAGCLEAHHEMFQAVFGTGRPRHSPGWHVGKEARLVADKLGDVPPASELELLSSRLSDPGPWLALVHGDPCPDNSLLVDGRIRLIDYEFARPSHALLDGVYWRMGFPTCWCAGRIPAEVVNNVDAIYRAELANAIPLTLDDRAYRTEIAYISAIWLFTCLSWRLDDALDSDQSWGISSIRARLLWYLEAVIEITGAASVLPGTREAAHSWLATLRKRWPEATPLGFYPAFEEVLSDHA